MKKIIPITMILAFLSAQVAAVNIEGIKKYMSGLFDFKDAKLSMTGSSVISKDKPEYKSEFLALGLPLNSDFYQLLTTDGKYNFSLSQLQIVPLANSNFGAGVVGQHIAGSDFESIQQYGFVVRMQRNNPKEPAQVDVRWLPDKEIIEMYFFSDGKKVFIDLIGSYDDKSNITSFTGGVDCKINKRISIGLEGKFEHAPNKLKRKLGIRAKYAF